MGIFKDGWTVDDVETVLARGIPDELLYVPIVVGMNAPDCGREWAEQVCIALATHPHPTVRGNAILGFGHIARTCGALSKEQVVPLIAYALQDPDESIRGHAEDAAADLRIYMGVRVPGSDLKRGK